MSFFSDKDFSKPGVVKADPGKLRLGVWNRLEPRPRAKDFSRTLNAPVADALYFILRQLQFGELKAEDTGTAIMAKVHLSSSPICRYAINTGDPVGYSENIPLEARIEAEQIPFDKKLNLQISNAWKKILKSKEVPELVFRAFIDVFNGKTNQAAVVDNLTNDDNTPASSGLSYKNADLNLKHKNYFQMKVLNGNILDGESFINYLKDLHPNSTVLDGYELDAITEDAIATHHLQIKQSISIFLDWFSNLFFSPVDNNSWNSSRLEYQFNLAASNKNGSKTPIISKEYYQGNPDWYVYEVDTPDNHTNGVLKHDTITGENTTVKEKKITLLPTDASFPGMPSKGYWEFEDGKINPSNINIQTTDISTIAFNEFMLLYSNDWFSIPFKVPVGSLGRVESIIVQDCFQFKTKINPANDQMPNSDWSMFNLSNTSENSIASQDARVFIPPVSFKTQESDPVEKVLFIRDEMANMVWAIEKIIPDVFEGGSDGYETYLDLKEYLLLNSPSTEEENVEGTYEYIFMTEIPENWIPFIPVNTASPPLMNVKLQRGKMLRNINGVDDRSFVRPKGVILSVFPEDASPYKPYLIEEEEVPREGIQVMRSFQRARWYDGKTICWLGRKKRTGRGEGSSGLLFDALK